VQFSKLPLAGAYRIDIDPAEDHRGFFARIWSAREFTDHGLNPELLESSLSFNIRKGTLRGLHFQDPPYEEAKLVTCLRGAIWDVMVDLRPASMTYRHWHAVRLSARDLSSVYVPEQFAHGFQTLEADSLVLYQIAGAYHPEAARGIRWDDPALRIDWPLEKERIISDRDQAYPLLDP
jgi:dTDP-4-dehydrorhamnose 3,5-epimerase